jgi:hypothetical protein
MKEAADDRLQMDEKTRKSKERKIYVNETAKKYMEDAGEEVGLCIFLAVGGPEKYMRAQEGIGAPCELEAHAKNRAPRRRRR